MSTIPIPIIGDTLELFKRVRKEPDRAVLTKFFFEQFPDIVPPCIGMFWSHGLELIITDADYFQDLFLTYNEVFTKHSHVQERYSELVWSSILWAKSAEPTYKPRRKLISHAFYKSKLQAMSKIMFDIINNRMQKWPTLFPSGELDLVKELEYIQGQIIVSVSIGPEYANVELPWIDHATGQTSMRCVGKFLNSIRQDGQKREKQAINILFPTLLRYLLTPYDRNYYVNNHTLLDYLKVIKAVKLEEIKQGKPGVDLFSILLNEGEDVYSPLGEKAERAMLDDISIIYVAATTTTQIAISNVMKYIHMDQYSDIKARLLAEIDSQMPFDAWDSQGNQINNNLIEEACSYDNIQESFEYTVMCFRESMRIEPPLPFSSSHMVTKDVVLARGTQKELKIRAGDEIHFLMGLLHHDKNQWGERHNEYIPDRFDTDSPHFLAPNGKKRHPYSYAPFFGGHRICLGKTLAENVAKKMVSMVLKFYTLEHADPKMKTEAINADIYMSQLPIIRFLYKKRTTNIS